VIRTFDILFSFIGLVFFSPLLVVLSVWIKIDSKGPILYKQIRIGKNGHKFLLYKLRSMKSGSDKRDLLTIGNRDPRITNAGYFLRKYKLDELPQLLNILYGDMSFVGPRPEVKKYVDMYTEEQKKVLLIKPGLTDYASIKFIDENELLQKSSDPEKTYLTEILPRKIQLNMIYIKNPSLEQYFIIIYQTLRNIVR